MDYRLIKDKEALLRDKDYFNSEVFRKVQSIHGFGTGCGKAGKYGKESERPSYYKRDGPLEAKCPWEYCKGTSKPSLKTSGWKYEGDWMDFKYMMMLEAYREDLNDDEIDEHLTEKGKARKEFEEVSNNPARVLQSSRTNENRAHQLQLLLGQQQQMAMNQHLVVQQLAAQVNTGANHVGRNETNIETNAETVQQFEITVEIPFEVEVPIEIPIEVEVPATNDTTARNETTTEEIAEIPETSVGTLETVS